MSMAPHPGVRQCISSFFPKHVLMILRSGILVCMRNKQYRRKGRKRRELELPRVRRQ